MSLDQISRWIERDIEDRRLTAGDAYLTAECVGKILGVSRATADRAMKALSSRHVLMRRQRSGTFVGPRALLADGRKPGLTTVHVVSGPSALSADRALVFGLIERLPARFPDVAVKLHLSALPSSDDDALKVIDGIAAGRDTRQAIVLVRPSPAVHRAARDSGLAAVTVDHAGADDPALPSVAFDDGAAGASIVRVAALHRAETALLLSFPALRAGDEGLTNGIAAAAGSGAIRIQRVEVATEEAGATAIRSTLEGLTLPAIVLARSATLAATAVQERSRLGIRPCALTVLSFGETPIEGALALRRDLGPAETIEWIAKALSETSTAADRILRIGAAFPRPECCPAESVLAGV